jgi:hypothetical protein
MVAERKYAARRIESGLYVQPSNDLSRLFVICRYEDGTDFGLEHGPARVTRWRWGQLSPTDAAYAQSIAVLDPDAALAALYEASCEREGYETKRAAVDAALSAEGER